MRRENTVENRKPRFFYGYIVILAAFVTWMMSRGTHQTSGVFFKPILSEFGWTRAMTAGASSLSSYIEGLLGIIVGGLTDRFGPRKVVLIFGSFLGIGLLLMSQISNLWQFYVVFGIVTGIGMSAMGVPTMITVARWFVKRRGLMTGIVQSGAGVGGMILAPLAGWLILTNGWRSAYIVLGATALVLVILAALFLKRDPSEVGQVPYGADETIRQGARNKEPSTQFLEFSFKEAIRTKQLWMLWVMLFIFGFCRSFIMVHIAAHVTDLGFSLTVGASVIAVMSGVSIIGRIGMGRLADFIGNRHAFVIGYTAIAASLLWLLVADELWMLYLFAVVYGFSWGTLAVIRMPITAEIFGLSSLGVILGVVDLGTQTGSVVGPLLAGWLFDLTGEYTIVFLVTVASAIIGLILTILLRPIDRKIAPGFQS